MKSKSLIVFIFVSVLITLSACTSNMKREVGISPYQIRSDKVSWASITGQITAISPTAIRINVGNHSMVVTMKNGVNGTSLLEANQKVTVYGKVTDLFFQARQIEADDMYIHFKNIYLVSDRPKKDFWFNFSSNIHPGIWFGIYGKVEVNLPSKEKKFILNVGEHSLTIDTQKIKDNPLDNMGYQKIERNQEVYVYGQYQVENDEPTIKAYTIVSVRD